MKSNVAINGIQSPRKTNIQKPINMYMNITTIPTLISLKFEPKVVYAYELGKKKCSINDQLFSKYSILSKNGQEVDSCSLRMQTKSGAF